jgi:hypothetical protein
MSMFNKKTEFGGAFKANEMVLTFAGFGAGYLITQVQAQYQTQTTRLRELGSNRTYYIEGDSQGSVSLNRVTGPSSSISGLVNAYSDVCGIPQNVITLSFAAGKCGVLQGGEPNVTFEGVLFNQWGIQAQSEQGVATTSLSGTFENLGADDEEGLSGILARGASAAAAAGL